LNTIFLLLSWFSCHTSSLFYLTSLELSNYLLTLVLQKSSRSSNILIVEKIGIVSTPSIARSSNGLLQSCEFVTKTQSESKINGYDILNSLMVINSIFLIFKIPKEEKRILPNVIVIFKWLVLNSCFSNCSKSFRYLWKVIFIIKGINKIRCYKFEVFQRLLRL